MDRHYVPYLGRLDAGQLAEVSQEVDQGMYGTVSAVAAWMAQRFWVGYSHCAVRAFVHKKALLVPGKLDAAEQSSFLEFLESFLAEIAGVSDEAIYFTDGVHPQHNTRADYVQTKRGKEKLFQSNIGRKRMNINGAINFYDLSDVQMVESDSIEGQSTQALFEKLLARHPDKRTRPG